MKTFKHNNLIKIMPAALMVVLSFVNPHKSRAQIINTVKGSTSVGFNSPYGVAVDDTGNVFTADWNNHKLDKMTPAGTTSFITLNGPVGVVFDKSSNKYLTLWDGNLVIKITPQGKIDTLVKKGMAGPEGIAIDPSDTLLYVTDWTANRVYSISITSGKLDTIANKSGTAGNAGDNGPATSATLGGTFGGGSLEEVAVDAQHNIYIADPASHRVRVIAGTSTSRHPVVGYIYPFAGTGVAGSSGDGLPAASAQLSSPMGVRVDTAGNVYITDNASNKIRLVDTAGVIHAFAGTGAASSTGDGYLAASAALNGPYGLAFDKYGNLYVSEQAGNRVRVITMGSCNVPVINSLSASQSACVNAKNVSFTVSATGTQPIAFQWKRKNTLVGNGDSTYIINTVAFTDSGAYTVIANNFCGADTSSTPLVLTVNPLPVVIITALQDTVCQGTQIPMMASGADNYTWSPSASLSSSAGPAVTATPALGPTTYTVVGTDLNGCSAAGIKMLVADVCTGLKPVTKGDVSIYPNPGNGLFTLKLNELLVNGRLEVFTITGEKIDEKQISNNLVATLDLTGYSASVYILQITSQKGIIRKRVVVQ